CGSPPGRCGASCRRPWTPWPTGPPRRPPEGRAAGVTGGWRVRYAGPMLSVHEATIRLFVHVAAATVWVGGRVVLAGLLPALRRLGPETTRAVARQFERLAWPAYAVLVVTGIWNLVEVDVADTTTEYQVTVAVKLVFVALSGIGA